MAELIERLHNLGKFDPSPMGFGRRRERRQHPALLLIGEVSARKVKSAAASATARHLDALLVDGVPPAAALDSLKKLLWGVRLGAADQEVLASLKEAGCDFVMLGDMNAHASLLADDGMARGTMIQADLEDKQARALDDLPFDFLILNYATQRGQLTISALMEYQASVSMVGKHIFLALSEQPEPPELERLRDLPADAIIVEMDALTAANVKRLRAEIDALEPRKPRSHGDESIVAQTSSSSHVDDDHDLEFDDDD